MEAALVLVAAVLLLSSTLAASEFCVCRSDQSTAVLQKAIDFSCGPQGNADCSAILQGGGCYNPNTVAAHCSWAANSYYQNNKAKGATCDFDGAATISTTDPSPCSLFLRLHFPFECQCYGDDGHHDRGRRDDGHGHPEPRRRGHRVQRHGMGSSLGPTGTMDAAAAACSPASSWPPSSPPPSSPSSLCTSSPSYPVFL
ncbi:unnamed protein product [Urochloa decumbens]|uniref:X8 domain-containing protein n=1 Tax=Urochloa decumbens TaxID=240449 RepID=A0ABC8WTG6_9POAL